MPTRVFGPRRGVTKPAPWRVTPRAVAPQWRGLWRDLAFAFLYWNGEVIDLLEYAQPNSATAGNATRTSTPFGVGIDHSGRLEFDSFAPLNPGTGGVTVLTYANAPATGRHTLVCQRAGNQDEHLEIRVGQKMDSTPPAGASTVDGHLYFACDDGSATGAEGASTDGLTPVDGGWHVFAGRRTADGATSVWSDGEDVTGFGQTDNDENINDTGTFVLGGLPGTSTISYQDRKVLDLGWNRGLSDAAMQQVGTYPFGLFRPQQVVTWNTVSGSTGGGGGGKVLPIGVAHYHLNQLRK